MEHPFLVFLDHTQRRSTAGRTPLDERSARRRDLYLTTHDTHNRQISMPPVGFEPTISAGERPCRSPAEILGSNPTGAWRFVCCECRVLSGRGLCDELITRPEESYRLWCVVVCDLETSRIGASPGQSQLAVTFKLPPFWLHKMEVCINLLKPTGYVMHHQFKIQQLYALPTLYLCVL